MSEDDNDWGELTLPPVEFTDCLKRLPATAPVNHAHIIDLNSYKLEMEDEGYDVKVWDAVMTMLFNISEQTINDFLDSKIKTFQLVQEFDGSSSSTKLVIWRQGGQALFAQYIVYAKEDLLEFDNLIRCTVNFDGSWAINAASFGMYTRNNLDHAWAGSFITTRIDRGLVAQDANTKSELAKMLGGYILQNQCWGADKGCKWTIKKT